MSLDGVLNTKWIYDVEVGFRLFDYFLSLLGMNEQMYLAFVACLSLIPFLLLYKRESSNTFLIISLFLTVAPFSLYFSGIRQCLAMTFGVPVYYFTKNKKIVPTLLMVVVACTIHYSAFILLLFYPVYHAKITKKWLYIVIPLMGIAFIFKKSVYSLLLYVLKDSPYETYKMSSTNAYGMLILLVLLTTLCICISNEDVKPLSPNDIGFRNLLLLTTFLQYFASLSPVAMRVNYYYLVFIPLAIDHLMINDNSRNVLVSKLASGAISIILIVYFINNMYVGSDILEIYPYLAFWE